MLTITPEAVQYIRKRNLPVRLELPPCIDACCFELQEAPEARFGAPKDREAHKEQVIEEITVFIPRSLQSLPLTLTVRSFLGFKHLAVEGWRLV